MKILHIIVGLGNGGAENTLLKLCSFQNSRFKHEVISLTKNKEILSKFKKNKIKVNFLNFKKISLNLKNIYQLFQIINKSKPKFIFCWMYHASFLSIIINFFKRKKIKFVWLIRHGSFHTKFTKFSTYILRYILKVYSNIPKAILYCSNFSEKIHTKYGFKANYKKVISNGVDTNKFKFSSNNRINLRKYYKIDNKYFIIGVVGRYHPQKNHEQLIRILKDKNFVDKKIAIIFIGKNVMKLKSAVKDNKNHKFIFINTKKDIHRYYSMFDLNMSLSLFGESFPNVIIEGMSCSIPTLASKIADNHKIINEKKMTFTVDSDYDLKKKLKQIIDNSKKKKFKTLNNNLRKRVNKYYNLKLMYNRYEHFLKNI